MKKVLQVGPFAFDRNHVIALLLAIACVVWPIYFGWTGPVSVKALLPITLPAVLAVVTLMQKSPRDLFKQLTLELGVKLPSTPPPPVDPTSVVITEKKEDPK